MRLPFELDPQIIHHIIYNQAGSIGKAVIELLMNAVDAQAADVSLALTRDGFECLDNGNGFASREEVLRYFGRFGTPHDEGDATYGRFRLGRGQIMAHARTVWRSKVWRMTVDTRTMGYNYDLDEQVENNAISGCLITGEWYEPMTETELLSAVQEIRDLVRYTPIRVELNGRQISRDPCGEKWDFEDDVAYYRVKEEGAVSIYNQGVLVRHDSAHQWGAGGLIVSKQAISLNISRTEILRKTCPVWKQIARQFGKMADELTSRLGDHRKTEARREKSAQALLAGDPKLTEIFRQEETVTILPGKRHISLYDFLRKCHHAGQCPGGVFTVAENAFDVPKGEAIARSGIAVVVHPQTLSRFGCYHGQDFLDAIDRIKNNVLQSIGNEPPYWGWGYSLELPGLVAFSTLREAYVERTQILTEKEALDKETRRAWTALRWCLYHYACLCTGGRRWSTGQSNGGKRFHILIGNSNRAEAWTDGHSYIAFNVDVIRRLKKQPMKVAGYLFSLLEHEIAHEGDSLECGHDEAFYQRFHDITVNFSEERQRYLHIWLMKYTTSLEQEGKTRGNAWRERYLLDRAGSGREKRGLPGLESVSDDPVMTSPVPAEDTRFIDLQNMRLVQAGLCPLPSNWADVVTQGLQAQQAIAEEQRQAAENRRRDDAEWEHLTTQLNEDDNLWQVDIAEQEALEEQERERIATLLQVPLGAIVDDILYWMMGENESAIRQYWVDKPWEQTPLSKYSADVVALIKRGETVWLLERNTAAAGFMRVEDYLKWRAEQERDVC
ncbi:DNA mismatch repair protein MutL [Chania multitudinisentens RB-25]|uniref:DNA mismatch repair protein MutL n=1 Tax=Chania multitudinisentens RB-25 TaxID=1441930 RepID=W0LA16_9GAMM|nr:ATP-binding protein [Chania multitudinisentens]AHG20663.1 DNA mismatch repair protein MutL [Chania multitudinisentens RB-25]